MVRVERSASNLGVAVVETVFDDGGNLLSLDRMGNARLVSVVLAADKAWTAAAFGLPTEES